MAQAMRFSQKRNQPLRASGAIHHARPIPVAAPRL